MAVGDLVNEISSVASSSYMDIQPAGTAEWSIHNIYHEADMQMEYYDGANSLIFDSSTSAGVYAKYSFHCSNGHRIRIKNTNVAAKLIGYDGIITHT